MNPFSVTISLTYFSLWPAIERSKCLQTDLCTDVAEPGSSGHVTSSEGGDSSALTRFTTCKAGHTVRKQIVKANYSK